MKNFYRRQKGFIHLIIPVIAIAVLALIVIFGHQSLNKQSKAAGESQYGSTPLSDLALYPRPAQNRLQTMAYLIINPTTFSQYKDYISKEIDYFWFDQSSLSSQQPDGSYTFTNLFNAINELKGLNSAMKLGTHAGGAGVMAPYHIPFSALVNEDLLHDSGGSVLKFTPDNRNSFINLATDSARLKIINKWKDVFNSNPNLSGIDLDQYYSYQDDAALANGCAEGPCNTKNFWESNLITLSQGLMSALAGKDVTYNGLYYNLHASGNNGTMNSGFVPYHTGVLSEWPHEIITSPTIFAQYLSTITSITSQGKNVFFWVQPQILPRSHPSYVFTNDLNLERFFLGAYLLIQQNPLTYFGYHPGDIYNVNNGMYFYSDWNLDFGTPSANYVAMPNGLYYRLYTKGTAVVNPTDQPQTFTFTDSNQYRTWDLANGAVVSGSTTISSKQGMFYLTERVAPTVSITSPVNGSKVVRNSTVTIAAAAADNTAVWKVEFFVNGVLKCTDTSSPYTCVWQVPGGQKQTYNLTAKAYDVWNNMATSSTVTVTSK